jgi:hypothetical protein
MTGSTWDLILIAVVVVIVLAAWIVLVFYADAHPAWRRPEAPAGHGTSGQAARPQAGTAGAQPGRRVRTDADVTTAGTGYRSARRDLLRREVGGGQGTDTGRPELTTPLR